MKDSAGSQINPSPKGEPNLINVLFIIDSLSIGGAENQVVTLAPALSHARYRVYVCCLRREGVQAVTLREKGVPVFSLGMRLRYWPLALYKLIQLIHQIKPKIVHTHLYEAGIWGRLAAILAGVPVIITTEHSNIFPNRRYKLLETLVNHFSDKMIAVSGGIRQWLIEKQEVHPEKIIFIPTAVDIKRFCGQESREQLRTELGGSASTLFIGTVARLVTAKRLDYLLEAAQEVGNSLPNARFLIIGDGPLREELETKTRQLDLTNCIRFLGSRVDIPELLSVFDIFVLSSEREGTPVAMLEAMAASKPVIATRVGGIPQVIQDGSNGFLVPPHDPSGLAKSILALAGNNTLRASFAKRGYQTVTEHFSIEVVCQQITSLYDNLLDKKMNRHA